MFQKGWSRLAILQWNENVDTKHVHRMSEKYRMLFISLFCIVKRMKILYLK